MQDVISCVCNQSQLTDFENNVMFLLVLIAGISAAKLLIQFAKIATGR